jgi:2-amino-4-hydroxy-6-hydroxymethyldihydropteridine diphosphokinase
MARCLIGCGSNLGQRREQLDRALELLRYMPGVRMAAVSRYRETPPIGGPAGQGAFLNGVCLIETDLPARTVLEMLAAVENTLHRERHERWGERTIDLDLLLYDDLIVDSAELTVPHPRMATRRFVLEPAAEIAADLRHPSAGCTIGDLLDNISTSSPLVAVVGVPGSGAMEVAATLADATMARPLHAPEPLPIGDDRLPAPLARWRQLLDAWTAPLARLELGEDPHGIVADYWCDMLPIAADESLTADELARFRAEVEASAARTLVPQVAILLLADASVIADRVAFRARQARHHTDVFADLASAAVLCDHEGSADDRVAALMRLQDKLIRRLRTSGERDQRTPKAVIPVDASDLARATDEAIAAVEAML